VIADIQYGNEGSQINIS